MKGKLQVRKETTMRKKPVEHWVEQLRSSDVRKRRAAAQKLRSLGDSQAVEPLLNALQDEDERVRAYAVIALGGLGERQVVEPLIACLGDRTLLVRQVTA